MKIKPWATMVMSGLAAATLAYVTPAIADDMNDQSGQTMQAPSDGAMPNASMPTDSMPNSSMPGAGNDSLDNDSGGPDSASGDDDY